jgi:hypothetical protein
VLLLLCFGHVPVSSVISPAFRDLVTGLGNAIPIGVLPTIINTLVHSSQRSVLVDLWSVFMLRPFVVFLSDWLAAQRFGYF